MKDKECTIILELPMKYAIKLKTKVVIRNVHEYLFHKDTVTIPKYAEITPDIPTVGRTPSLPNVAKNPITKAITNTMFDMYLIPILFSINTSDSSRTLYIAYKFTIK